MCQGPASLPCKQTGVGSIPTVSTGRSPRVFPRAVFGSPPLDRWGAIGAQASVFENRAEKPDRDMAASFASPATTCRRCGNCSDLSRERLLLLFQNSV